jgi:hypothetical protein
MCCSSSQIPLKMRLRNWRLALGSASVEQREVFERPAGVVEVGDRVWDEAVEFCVDSVTAGDVFGAWQVAEFVEVSSAVQPLFERDAPAGGLSVLGCVGREAGEDLLADRRAGCEVGEELGEL